MKEDQITLSAFKDLDGAQSGDISTNLSPCHISSFLPSGFIRLLYVNQLVTPPPSASPRPPKKPQPEMIPNTTHLFSPKRGNGRG